MFFTPSATVEKIARTEPTVSNILKARTYISRHQEQSAEDLALLAGFDTAIDQHCARFAGTGDFDSAFVHRVHESAKRVLGI